MQLPENELKPQLLASAAMNPWAQHDSASRIQMLGGHLTQALVIEGSEPRRCQSGVEREFGKATFKVEMPCHGEIIKVIEKFPQTISRDSIKLNPLRIIVFRDTMTNEYGILELTNYHSLHQNFGFNFKMNHDNLRKISQGTVLPKGMILADSPNIDEMGNYNMGLEMKVAMMSLPPIIEDGMLISESAAERMATTGFETRWASWGRHYYPLNIYGDDTTHKAFPDIGDRVRDDGLLFALRRLSEPEDYLLAPVEMTPAALREPDSAFDRLVWAEPGARIVDIKIHHNIRNNPEPTPPSMAIQTRKYYGACLQFHNAIISLYNELRRRHGESLRLSEPFHQLIVESLIYTGDPSRLKAIQLYRRIPLDDWRVEITFEQRLIPDKGYKATDLHGNKGVFCRKVPDADMPFDPITGERADIVMDGFSRIKRMNSGGLYEQYINASAAELTRKIRKWCSEDNSAGYQKAWDSLLRFYEIVSPRFYQDLLSPAYRGTPREHVDCVIKDGIYLNIPTDNPAESPTIIAQLQEEFPAPLNPVIYRGESGEMVTTKNPVLIGSLYMILLEKTGNDWMGVSSAKLQHFGIPAKMTQQDRYAMPGRVNPVRNFGESEVRLGVAILPDNVMAKMMEMSNNPVVHKHVCSKIMETDQPSNIKQIWNTDELPMGGNRSTAYVKHILHCDGIELYDEPGNIEDGLIYGQDHYGSDDEEFEIGEDNEG